MSITIDPEFKALIPPLTPEEFQQLEENCVAEGIRDALIVWKTPSGNEILIDGHNRWEISAKHGGIRFNVKYMQFDDRNAAKLWIIRNQLGRRNLTAYNRAKLSLQGKELIAVEAKKNQVRTSENRVNQKSDEQKINTTKELAKIAGVSHDTIHKVEVIEAKGSEELKQKARSGEMSINQAWLEIKERERKQEDMSAKAHLEKAIQRHEEIKASPVVTIDDIRQDKKDVAEIAESKCREIEAAIKKILFIGAGLEGGDSDFTIISSKTVGGERIRCLMNDIRKTIGILNKLWSDMEKARR